MMYPDSLLLLLLAAGATPTLAAFPWPRAPFLKKLEKSTWTPPRETDPVAENAGIERGWSPRPTDAPELGEMELVRRIDGFVLESNTCGFVSSSWSNPFTCLNLEASCTHDGTYMGCCDDPTCSLLKTKCLHFEDSTRGSCGLPTDFHTVCCSSSLYPSCYTYLFSTTASPGQTFTVFDCDVKTGTGTLLDYPPEFTRPGGTIKSSAKPTSSSSSTTSTGSSAPIETNDDDDDGGGGGGTNVGAIVGGTVGGLAAVGAAGLLGFFFFIRRKKAGSDTQSQGPGVSMMGQTPASPGAASYAMPPAGYQGPQGFNTTQGYQQFPPNFGQQGYNQQSYPQYGQPTPPQGYGQYQAPYNPASPNSQLAVSVSPGQSPSPGVEGNKPVYSYYGQEAQQQPPSELDGGVIHPQSPQGPPRT